MGVKPEIEFVGSTGSLNVWRVGVANGYLYISTFHALKMTSEGAAVAQTFVEHEPVVEARKADLKDLWLELPEPVPADTLAYVQAIKAIRVAKGLDGGTLTLRCAHKLAHGISVQTLLHGRDTLGVYWKWPTEQEYLRSLLTVEGAKELAALVKPFGFSTCTAALD